MKIIFNLNGLKAIFTSAAMISLLIGNTVFSAEPSDLFLDVPPSIVATPLPSSDLIIRQRMITIRFERIPADAAPGSTLQLNLFEDISVQAVLDEIFTGLSGDYVWIGHSAGNVNDRILMVVLDGVLSGSLRIDGRFFQVRPVEGNRHVIREVDTALLAKPSDGLRSMSPLEIDVVTLVNQERAIVGLHNLTSDDRLANAAQGHSADMAENGYFSHDSQDGRTAKDRIVDAGYPCSECGENIAGGGIYSSPELVMEGWMLSQDHRENILRQRYCGIGVGYVYKPDSEIQHVWTQNFGRQPDVDVCPTADAADSETKDPSSDSAETGGGSSCFITTSR